MKKIGIIGAGITGLSLAKLLSDKYQVEILEQDSSIGGIAKTKVVEGVTYHPIGGHCLNSKHLEVMNFIFNIMSKEKFNNIQRNAKISLDNQIISYPIEYSVKEVFKFNKKLAFNITLDFLTTSKNANTNNLEEWFINNFGKTLASRYFIPYNNKIWSYDLKNMNFEWVSDKLPIPSKKDFLKSLVSKSQDKMPHSSFFYPKSNNQKDFINALADDITVIQNYNVYKIEKNKDRWIINDEKEYDMLINTSPLNELHKKLENCPDYVIEASKLLKYNKISTILWKSKKKDFTWLYVPSSKSIFHRIINIGKFFQPNTNHMISEVIGEIDFNIMKEEMKKFDFLLEPLDFNISKHAYVIFDKNTKKSKELIFKYLEDLELITVGRFGEWEYYNMDICIKRALEVSKKLLVSA